MEKRNSDKKNLIKSKNRQIQIRKNRQKREKRRKDILFSLIFIGILSIIATWRGAVISELEYKNLDLSLKKERLENKKSDLNTEIEQTKESDWLKTQAEDRINMRDAQKNQIIKVDMTPNKKENKFITFFKKVFGSKKQEKNKVE